MTTLAYAPPFSSSPLWYLTRSTGIVSFVLITVALAFGVAATQRALASRHWPRFATQTLHRNVSLIGLALLIVHIVTTVTDSFVKVGLISVFVPFTSPYKRVWLGLGTLAFDLILLVIVTSLLRLRLPQRLWLGIHLSVYAAWPISLLHYLRTGTDAKSGQFGAWLALACAATVGAAVGVRLVTWSKTARTATSLPLTESGRKVRLP
jgi:sulfoxide reductase heme-binding subunit YedZ